MLKVDLKELFLTQLIFQTMTEIKLDMIQTNRQSVHLLYFLCRIPSCFVMQEGMCERKEKHLIKGGISL